MKRLTTPLTVAAALAMLSTPVAFSTSAIATPETLGLTHLAPLGARAEAEERCYPSGLCDGEDFSKPKEDYS